jgi:hypothetical protein
MAATRSLPAARIASRFRPAVRLVLIALGLWRLTSLAVSASPLLGQAGSIHDLQRIDNMDTPHCQPSGQDLE